MTRFRVWAPEKRTVALHAAGEAHAMRACTGGWWALELPGLPPEVDYAYALDGGAPLPDPRSLWQPAGVDGPSRTLAPGSFRWEVEHWESVPLARAVLYELHVGTFTAAGTFAAACAHLDALVALGVTHVELMPVAEFSGTRGWGYDGVALFPPHHAYGGPHGLVQLVDACHARGLGVLLDVVYNHLGPVGNHLARFGPYFTDRYATPWGEAPNLDGPDSDEVRRFFLDNALHWLRHYRLDGLRLDATHALLDMSALHLVEELATRVHALAAELGRPLWVIAEDDRNDPRLVAPRSAGGFGCDARWNDDFHHAVHALLTGERHGYYADFGRLADLGAALERVHVYDGRHSPHRRRRHGRPVDSLGALGGEHFLAYAQTHDQVGNRARGERLAALVSEDRLRIAAALVVFAPYVPFFFQGEEWGASTPFPYFTDHADAALGEAVRAGRRREFAAFGWQDEVLDPQAEATFRAAKLDWSERTRAPHASLLAWHRDLLALRRAHPALGTDRRNVRVELEETERWLVLHRGPLALAVNLAPEPRAVPVQGALERRLLLASRAPLAVRSDSVVLAPDTLAIAADAHGTA